MQDSAPAPSINPSDPSSDRSAEATIDCWNHPSVILVATDLSDLHRLVPYAFEQAVQTGAHLLLLHVVSGASAVATDPVGMPYYDPSGALDFAAKELEPWCAMAHQQNIACDALVREGNPAQQIGAAARQFKAGRVLLGTRSRSRLGKLLLGSVAEQVLRSVNLPVITVGPEAHLPVGRGNEERTVLHATTLREASRPSAALACQMAASQGAKLVLLHVLPPTEDFASQKSGSSGQPAGLDTAALHELQILAAEIGAAGNTIVESRVVHGNPSIEILAEAAERNASLIVLGVRHRSVFEDLTRDRTVYRVLAHARCPVLTLREPQTALAPAHTKQMASHL
jgi:nucleotide-binding universal stress UspA family protein